MKANKPGCFPFLEGQQTTGKRKSAKLKLLKKGRQVTDHASSSPPLAFPDYKKQTFFCCKAPGRRADLQQLDPLAQQLPQARRRHPVLARAAQPAHLGEPDLRGHGAAGPQCACAQAARPRPGCAEGERRMRPGTGTHARGVPAGCHESRGPGVAPPWR